MPPQLLIGSVALGMILAAYGGWVVRGWKADSDQLVAVNKTELEKAKLELKADGQADQIELLRASHEQASANDHTTIREIFHDVKVPAECDVPTAAGSVLDRAIQRANAEASGELGSTVPSTAGQTKPDARP